jgi:Spy/CpxP family protein refolding chaperone
MKHIALTLSIAATALLTLPSLSFADGEPGAAGGKRHGRFGGGQHANIEERIKQMTERLGVTQEQQDKFKAIFAKGAEQMKALREKGRENLTEEDRAKMRDFFKAQMEEAAAILTPEQKENVIGFIKKKTAK